MSLYDDLGDSVKDTKDVAGWSSSFKFMQSQLQAKKAGNSSTPGGKKRGGTLAPVIDLNKSGDETLHFDSRTGKAIRSSGPALQVPPFIVPEPSVFAGVKDEYNPLFPNDYEDMIKKRRRERRERERERDRERDERAREKGDERPSRRRDDEEDDDGDKDKNTELKPRLEDVDDDYEFDRSKMGAAIAPPKSLLEDSSSTPPPDTGRVQNPFGLDDEPPPQRVIAGSSFGLGGSVASKIMAKYGYKDGQGLGKKEQGMSQALLVEKTSRRGGKIIHEKDIKADSPTPMQAIMSGKPDLSNANLLKNPSKVVLLRNMVGPGEVDPELEAETAEECSKYGKVTKCVIFEIPEVPEEEAVRIFVEFERQEAAIKAIVDLNGRYFGGKIVRACFYNPDKFRRLDLADDLL